MEIGEGVFQVKATTGDSQLGGDDFDSSAAAWLDEQGAIGAKMTKRLSRKVWEQARAVNTGPPTANEPWATT